MLKAAAVLCVLLSAACALADSQRVYIPDLSVPPSPAGITTAGPQFAAFGAPLSDDDWFTPDAAAVGECLQRLTYNAQENDADYDGFVDGQCVGPANPTGYVVMDSYARRLNRRISFAGMFGWDGQPPLGALSGSPDDAPPGQPRGYVATVPEPFTAVLLAAGCAALLTRRRRKRL
jgi:hypothetical protein